MLVLTRKIGDVIAIGDNVKVVVMGIKGKQVRLGIDADKDTVVHREEIYQKIKKETTAAAGSTQESTNRASAILRENRDKWDTGETKDGKIDKKRTIIIRKNPNHDE